MTSAAKKYNDDRYAKWSKLGLCRRCGKRKPAEDKVTCTICSKKQKAYFKKHSTKRGEYQTKYISKLKAAAFLAYGGYKCVCCGTTIKEFLTIDHVNGGGAKHRKEIGRATHSTYLWLKRNNYPSNFRILCMNCNFSYGVYGYCPHNDKRRNSNGRRNVQIRG